MDIDHVGNITFCCLLLKASIIAYTLWIEEITPQISPNPINK